ncbi:hypothetical protein PAV_7c00390 [Paenibacillus alvei DSM 29]|nr:hypothetical protein PAV_7c00390 [Paenibacillus alvei DSM 29]
MGIIKRIDVISIKLALIWEAFYNAQKGNETMEHRREDLSGQTGSIIRSCEIIDAKEGDYCKNQ